MEFLRTAQPAQLCEPAARRYAVLHTNAWKF